MATDCIAQVTFEFHDKLKPVVARFDQTHASTDGGAVLLKEFVRRTPEGVVLREYHPCQRDFLVPQEEIGELNTVRKHLSRVKGGRLAALLSSSPSLSLVISDVLGDRLDVIASGPTVPDPTTPRHLKVALHVSGPAIDPDRSSREPDPVRIDRATTHARERYAPHRVLGTETCIYTMAPDEDFVLDRRGPIVVA